MGLHGGCQTFPLAIHGTPWKLPRLHLTLSMGLHGGCQTFPLAIHGTPWKLPRFHTSRGTPRVPYNTCPEAGQNCAGLMRAERHETRRDVVSSQTEGNSMSVVDAVVQPQKSCKFISRVKHHVGKKIFKKNGTAELPTPIRNYERSRLSSQKVRPVTVTVI